VTKLNLAVIAGDGIGQEVTGVALSVLEATLGAQNISATPFDLGATRYLKTGEILTDADLAALKTHDAILLGAIGDPKVPAGVLERGLLLKLRFAFDHHINLRPSKLYAGVSSVLAGDPKIDFVVVREGTEGPYVGNGGVIRPGTPHEIANEVSVNTAFGVSARCASHSSLLVLGPASTSRWCTRPTCLCTPARSGREPLKRSAKSFQMLATTTCT
jgi:3-isopropylmalate dehydrogenase